MPYWPADTETDQLMGVEAGGKHILRGARDVETYRESLLCRSVVQFCGVAKSSHVALMRALQLLREYEEFCDPLVRSRPEGFDPDLYKVLSNFRHQRQALAIKTTGLRFSYRQAVEEFDEDNKDDEESDVTVVEWGSLEDAGVDGSQKASETEENKEKDDEQVGEKV